MTITSKFVEEISQFSIGEEPIAIAVSGGSDSLALCFLLHHYLNGSDKLIALTINHALRKESLNEALQIHELLKKHNIKHAILNWTGAKPKSNIQEKARIARYGLLTDYCHKNNIPYLMTGHQQNDQAENFIIRAEHGAGIYGLAGIPKLSEYNGIKILRPLLNFSKEELRAFLIEKNIEWIEDPSNQSNNFTRNRVRKFLKRHPAWIKNLANISRNLNNTKEAIEYFLNQTISSLVKFENESAEFNLELFNKLPQEIRFRMMERILQKIGEKQKTARSERIEKLLAKLMSFQSFKASTLANCLIKQKKGMIIITKEV